MGHAGDLLVLAFLFSSQLSVTFAVSTATLSPLSFNASLNSTTLFECTVTGADRADWLVNGSPFDSTEVSDRGIKVVSMLIDSGAYQSNLSIPATAENNETMIQCLSVNFSTSSVRSPVATYLVQGILEAPSTAFSSVEDSHRTLVWDAPHTLDITDVAPDIQFFTVQENITGSSMDLTETEYSFPNLAVPVGFSVSAWNVVGEGETALISHEPCEISLEQQTIRAEEVTETVSFEEGGAISLTLSFRWTTDCIPVFSVEIEEESGGTSTASHGPLIPSVSGSGEEMTLTLSLSSTGLADNTHYTAQLTSVSAQRELEAEGAVPLSTFDVQRVTVTFTASSITTTCHFAAGSLALGCSVSLRDEGGAEVRVGQARRALSPGDRLSQTSTDTESGLDLGVYTVRVYDIESNGETVTNGPPAVEIVVNITEATPEPTPAASPSATPGTAEPPPVRPEDSSESASIVGPIAGVVGGMFLVVLVAVVLLFCVWMYSSGRRRKSKGRDSPEREFVLFSTGTTISLSSQPVPHLSPAHTQQASSAFTQVPPKRDTPPPPTYSDIVNEDNLKMGEKRSQSVSEQRQREKIERRSNRSIGAGIGGGIGGGGGGVRVSKRRSLGQSQLSQESQVQLLDDTDSAQGTLESQKITNSLRKALEATRSSPASAPVSPHPASPLPVSPHPTDQTSQGSLSEKPPVIKYHAHLQRHQRSSSLGGRPITSPTHTPHPLPSHRPSLPRSHPLRSYQSSHPPSLPPKRVSQTKRDHPLISSTPPPIPPQNFVPEGMVTPPPTLPPQTLTYDDIMALPSGSGVLRGPSIDQNKAKNPLYDTATAVQGELDKSSKRGSVNYTEVKHAQPTTESIPKDKESVLYSELNVDKLVPRLPKKKSQSGRSPSRDELSRAY